jgi:hypothetical protein
MTKLMRTELLVLGGLVLLGIGNTVAIWVRGDPGRALGLLGMVAVVAVILVLVGRSHTLRRRLFGTDERSNAITLFAGAWAGFALFCTLYVGFLVDYARGDSGEPYYWAVGLYTLLFILIAVGRTLRQ